MICRLISTVLICLAVASWNQFTGAQSLQQSAQSKQARTVIQDRVGAFQPAASSPDLEIATRPPGPWIEFSDSNQMLNFDFLVTNHGQENYKLVSIQLRVYDHGGKLELEREVNGNGSPPALDSMGPLELPSHSVMDIFQPFYLFDKDVDLSRIHLRLLFMRDGHPAAPVPVTADRIISADVVPAHYTPPKLCLPLRGLVLVHDGHDFYSHHRRFSLVKRFEAAPGTAVSANLYAYDFVLTTPEGDLFHGSAARKEDWLSYGAQIFSPAAGSVQEAVTDIEENSFSDAGSVQQPARADIVDPNGFGNHVKILQSDGTVIWLLHMKTGSVKVTSGDRVSAGQLLGAVGFSGDSLFPHLHFAVTEGAAYPSQGVPSYFKNYFRVLGGTRHRSVSGQIDTGELVESEAGACGAGGSSPRR